MQAQTPVSRLKTYIPILGGLPSYQTACLTADVIAGLTLWGLVAPEAMAYAGIAGLPPQARPLHPSGCTAHIRPARHLAAPGGAVENALEGGRGRDVLPAIVVACPGSHSVVCSACQRRQNLAAKIAPCHGPRLKCFSDPWRIASRTAQPGDRTVRVGSHQSQPQCREARCGS